MEAWLLPGSQHLSSLLWASMLGCSCSLVCVLHIMAYHDDCASHLHNLCRLPCLFITFTEYICLTREKILPPVSMALKGLGISVHNFIGLPSYRKNLF